MELLDQILHPNPLIIIAMVFLMIAIVVTRIQLQAKKCHRHTKIAGALAWVIIIVCILIGLFLLTIV